MSLVAELEAVIALTTAEFKKVRTEMSNISGGSSSGDIDGGLPSTNYGGTTPVDGGAP
jgi:hypothetical protein